MMPCIAVILPGAIGGVKTFTYKLIRGLQLEGFLVEPIPLQGSNYLMKLYSDLANLKRYNSFDAVIFTGSMAWLSQLFIKIPTILFIHGFVVYELMNVMKYSELKSRLWAASMLSTWNTLKVLKSIDLYVCHCLTTCKINGIKDRFTVLTEFILPDELEYLESLRSSLNIKNTDIIRIITYSSYAHSPRLLSIKHLVTLAKTLKKRIKRKFEFIIIDPKAKFPSVTSSIKFLAPMSRQKFLSLLASSHLYVDTLIDEELRNTTIEAMAVGVPVAKLTHPRYWDRQDYSEDVLILGRTFKELTEKIVKYINNIEYYYHYYSKHALGFVQTRRTWDAVKEPFLKALLRLIK